MFPPLRTNPSSTALVFSHRHDPIWLHDSTRLGCLTCAAFGTNKDIYPLIYYRHLSFSSNPIALTSSALLLAFCLISLSAWSCKIEIISQGAYPASPLTTPRLARPYVAPHDPRQRRLSSIPLETKTIRVHLNSQGYGKLSLCDHPLAKRSSPQDSPLTITGDVYDLYCQHPVLTPTGRNCG